jgi:hypothetical protein
VRVRFFTDVDAYDDYFVDGNGYPNYQPDGDTFIEGGCYLTDVGLPNYPVSIFDDADEDDPKDTVTGNGPSYDVTLNFEMEFGVAPYAVELDWDYDFLSWGGSGHTMTLPSSPFGTNGKLSDVVSVDPTPAGGNGDYFFALRVTDNSPTPDQSQFFWPDSVPLKPSLSYVVVNDSAQAGDLSATQCAAALSTIIGSPVPVVTSASLSVGDLDAYTLVFWCTNDRYLGSGVHGIVASDYNIIAPYMDQGGNIMMFWPCQGFLSTDWNAAQTALCKEYLGFKPANTFYHGARRTLSSSYKPHIDDVSLQNGPGLSGMLYIQFKQTLPYYAAGYFDNVNVDFANGAASGGWSFSSTRENIIRFDSNGPADGGKACLNMFYFYDAFPGNQLATYVANGTQVQMLQNFINWMDPLLLP